MENHRLFSKGACHGKRGYYILMKISILEEIYSFQYAYDRILKYMTHKLIELQSESDESTIKVGMSIISENW